MARPDRASFRLPAWALLLPVMLLFLITPLATADAWWGVTFIVPLVALIWVGITRTTANATRVKTYGLLGTRRMDWADLDRLEVRDARWVVAVGNDGRRMRLSMVRPHDLRRLIAVSGGNLRVGDDAMTAEEQQQPPFQRTDATVPDTSVPAARVSDPGGPVPPEDISAPDADAVDTVPAGDVGQPVTQQP